MSADQHDLHEECKLILKKKTAEFTKREAVLIQKIELLELKLDDNTKRLDQVNKMHETMMTALQDKAYWYSAFFTMV